MKLFSIPTGNLKLDGGAMFGVIPKVMWSKVYPADENNYANWSMRCLLIDDGKRKILIDNGIGDKQDAKFFSRYHLNGEDTLEKSLNINGYSLADITDVILTHLHFDHCGGSVKYNENKELVLTFPNADYWVGKTHWDLMMNPNILEKASFLEENIMPIQKSGHLRFIEKEGELFPNIYIKIFNGHTFGQVIPHIKVENKTLVYCADLLPSSAHIPMAWVMAYDTYPLQSLTDKDNFLTNALENEYTLFFEHDLYKECCTIQQTEKGARIKDSFTLKEWMESI